MHLRGMMNPSHCKVAAAIQSVTARSAPDGSVLRPWASNTASWVSAEVQFFVDGKRATTEEYSDIQTGIALDAGLWDAEKWLTVDHSYFKKK